MSVAVRNAGSPTERSFAQIAVGRADAVTRHDGDGRDKIAIVDRGRSSASCTSCGTHMFGRIENKDQPFYGPTSYHTNFRANRVGLEPIFAAVRVRRSSNRD